MIETKEYIGYREVEQMGIDVELLEEFCYGIPGAIKNGEYSRSIVESFFGNSKT